MQARKTDSALPPLFVFPFHSTDPPAICLSSLLQFAIHSTVIPIKDPVVISKIYQNYRIGYLKDAILPRALDEATVATLNSIIHSNNAIVVLLLREDNTFTKELFARLQSPTTSTDSKKALVNITTWSMFVCSLYSLYGCLRF